MIIKKWAKKYFGGVPNKRSRTNIPATLRSTGLSTGIRPLALSSVGLNIASAASAMEAAQLFCVHLLKSKHCMVIIEAVRQLAERGERITKASLKKELQHMGVEGLASGTTDHTTARNWLVEAGVLGAAGAVNDVVLKTILGVTTHESSAYKSLTLAQQIFVRLLRRRYETSSGPFPTTQLVSECLAEWPQHFDDAHFARKITKPLEKLGWVTLQGLGKGPQGGRSGQVAATKMLLDIPSDQLSPDFTSVIPTDIRGRLQIDGSALAKMLSSRNTTEGGLALELLAAKIALDLGLQITDWRLRSKDTAFAEVDLVAEGSHLLFSRWVFQCKRLSGDGKVTLSDVAKEVGIAAYTHAHVIAMVTTTGFTQDAVQYAQTITRNMYLQFVFIDGGIVQSYLEHGWGTLRDFVSANAKSVMKLKNEQAPLECSPKTEP